MESILVHLHVWLSTLAQTVAKPVFDLALKLNFFGVTAFLLGIVGATAPCQLTSNSSAIALVTSSANKRSIWSKTAYFVLGKALVYVALGIAAVLIGTTIEDIPFFGDNLFRKLLGPVLILVGLVLFGLIPLRMNFLSVVHLKAKKWIALKNSALSLGLTMGFLFCPTLFWLFFGVVVPKSGTSFARMLDPVFFAVGTAVPLLLYTLFLSMGTKLLARMIDGVSSAHKLLRVLSGIMFMISGIYETVNFWFI